MQLYSNKKKLYYKYPHDINVQHWILDTLFGLDRTKGDFSNIKAEIIYDIVYNNTNNSDIIERTREDKRFCIQKKKMLLKEEEK